MPIAQVNLDYVNGKVEETMKYLKNELAVLDSVKSYSSIQKYIDQLPDRLSHFVEKSVSGDFTEDAEKELYRSKIYTKLDNIASTYDLMQGSVTEEIGKNIKYVADTLRD